MVSYLYMKDVIYKIKYCMCNTYFWWFFSVWFCPGAVMAVMLAAVGILTKRVQV